MTLLKQIRDDISSAIAALPEVTARAITPVAMWVPEINRASGSLPTIIVSPTEQLQELVSRSVVRNDATMQVAVCEALGTDAEAAGEAGHLLMDAIIAAMLGKRIGVGLCVAARVLTVNSPDHWREHQQFTGIVELRFKL